MPTVRELITTWGFDINESPLKSMEKSITGVKHLVQAVFAGEATRKIWEFISSTAEAGHEAALTAQRVGVNAQALMGLQHAAYMSDVANEELTTGLKFLSSHMFDAAKGSAEAMRNFNILGIKTRDGNKHLRGADEVLGDIADKFSAMPDGAKKTALAVEMFGRGGIAMIPMLNKGRAELKKFSDEAKQFGLVMDEKAMKQSELFMDSLKRLKSILTGMKREIGIALIPTITQYINKLIQWVKANNGIIKQNIKQFFLELGRILKDVWQIVQTGIGLLRGLSSALGGTASSVRLVMRALEVMLAGKVIWGIVAAIGAIPAAIIAAVAIIYLVIDDVVGYFHGKKSLIGTFIEAMQKAFSKMPFVGVFFDLLKQQLYDMVHLVDYIRDGWNAMAEAVSQVVADIKSLFKMGLPPGLSSLIGGMTVNAGGALFGVQPGGVAAKPAAAMAGGWSGGSTLTFAPNVNMSFTGAGSMENPHAIRNIVMEALDAEHRKAMKDFAKVVER